MSHFEHDHITELAGRKKPTLGFPIGHEGRHRHPRLGTKGTKTSAATSEAQKQVAINVAPEQLFQKPFKSKRREGLQCCEYTLMCITFFLVIAAVGGPIYAFTAVSCVSTKTCRIVGLLGLSGASCKEGAGDESAYLMDGEKCTPQCPDGLVSSVPELTCSDGTTLGAEEFKCQEPPPPPPSGDKLGGLIQGAVTGGEIQTACRRAAHLTCSGPPGGTALLLQWEGENERKCKALLDECRELNKEFEYMQFDVDPNYKKLDERIFGPQEPPTGSCKLGCWNERPQPSTTPPAQVTVAPWYYGDVTLPPNVGKDLCGGPLSSAVPICIFVNGSCNLDDNGDYYRPRECASGLPQWVMEDTTHRIRYDDQPTPGQGGKWIMENGFGKDATLNTYGHLSGRQDSFDQLPHLNWQRWVMQCKVVVDPFTTLLAFRVSQVTLSPCTCTREFDCSGHGTTRGSKTIGPNCVCVCDSGFTGKHCETPLCKTPQVYHGATPACAEGDWIFPDQKCTTSCADGYKPTSPFVTCLSDASAFSPPLFYCIKKATGPNLAEMASAQFGGTTPTPTPCSELSCSFRGTPTGDRRSDGSCVCNCMDGYINNNCDTYSGLCVAPLGIVNSKDRTCVEGNQMPTRCTANCLDGYWAVPEVLHCTPGTNELEPKTFKCFGGPPIEETWCGWMQGISIGTSVMSGCALVLICVHKSPVLKRKPVAFVIGDDMLVDMDGDQVGEYYVVRSECKDKGSELPHRISASYVDGDLQTGTNHIDATTDRAYDHIKHILAEERYRKGLATLADLLDHPDEIPADEIEALKREIEKEWRESREGREYQEHQALIEELADEATGVVDPGAHKKKRLDDIALIDTILGEAGFERHGRRASIEGPSSRNASKRRLSIDGSRDELTSMEVRNLTKQTAQSANSALMDQEADKESTQESDLSSMSEMAMALPGEMPAEEIEDLHVDWHMKYHAADEEAERKRYEDAHDSASRNISEEQKHAIEFKMHVDQAIEDTWDERNECEEAIQAALAVGDGEGLKEALVRTKAVIKRLRGAPTGVTNMLERLVKLGDARYEQYYEYHDRHASHDRWLDRIRTGKAADWHMSVSEFWEYAEAGNLAAVNAGIKAFLPVLSRSPDGNRHTVLHVACRQACREAQTPAAAALLKEGSGPPRHGSKAAATAPTAGKIQASGAAVSSTARPAQEVGTGPDAESVQDFPGAEPAAWPGQPRKLIPPGYPGYELPEAGADAGAGGGDAGAGGEKGADGDFSSLRLAGEPDEPDGTCFEEDPVPTTISDAAAEFDARLEKLALEELESNRLGVVKALLTAKASPNTCDASDQTPLDLAVSEGGPGADDLPIVKKLKDLGLATRKEAAVVFKKEAQAEALKASGSRLTGNTPKPKPKGRDPRSMR